MPVICSLTYSTSHCRCQIHSAPFCRILTCYEALRLLT
nr:MAG TPA: hypothetical protein [Caudoviricetes sp.]